MAIPLAAVVETETGRVEVAFIAMPLRLAVPAVKLPDASRFTIAFGVFPLVGAMFQFRPSVPLLVTGDPVTVKSEMEALSPTLFTVPEPVPGNVWPEAKVNRPLLLIRNPVSAGGLPPEP